MTQIGVFVKSLKYFEHSQYGCCCVGDCQDIWCRVFWCTCTDVLAHLDASVLCLYCKYKAEGVFETSVYIFTQILFYARYFHVFFVLNPLQNQNAY